MSKTEVLQERPVTFRQQNLNRSNIATQHVINSTSHSDTDFLLFQEPYLDQFKNTRATAAWRVIYPSGHTKDAERKTHSLILVSKQVPSNCWNQLEVHDLDVTAIKICIPKAAVLVFNVYCDVMHSRCLKAVEEAIGKHNNAHPTTTSHIILAGDFNRHHPMWDDPSNTQLFTAKNLDEAEFLIDFSIQHDLLMTLPPKAPTLESLSTKSHTRPDNVFMSSELTSRIIRCGVVEEEQPPRTDHFPIVTTLNLPVGTDQEKKVRDFKNVD